MLNLECFLCNPDENLLIKSSDRLMATVGLGPLTSTFCILASSSHARSYADVATVDRQAIKDLVAWRGDLEKRFGPLLLSEHGRVPICREDDDHHEQHCFHAHALLFKTKHSVEDLASSYFANKDVFPSVPDALDAAREFQQYTLISPSVSRAIIFSGPLNVPRQLVRTLVAINEGTPDLADWRIFPRPQAASDMAANIREVWK
ncbi:hypothetical protein ACC736_32880 [Rhizobium ruizarguesonis]